MYMEAKVKFILLERDFCIPVGRCEYEIANTGGYLVHYA